mmetsp:Transcript_41372/g.82843  ORF Transcript_41372/g.82843 Transcript_41372/m.82843 type:complete len:89 (+) Transcript_41372:877-1143(+)
MALQAWMRCFTSRYDDGSSNMYTSAFWTATTAMAKRCSSPPDRSCTPRPRTLSRSNTRTRKSFMSMSFFSVRISPTMPLIARGMWSTY